MADDLTTTDAAEIALSGLDCVTRNITRMVEDGRISSPSGLSLVRVLDNVRNATITLAANAATADEFAERT